MDKLSWPKFLRRSSVYEEAASLWEASRDDASVRDQSHWLGEGRWADENAWLTIGRHHWKHFEALERLSDSGGTTGRMVEWGPGGGANLVKFMERFPVAYGVDISKENLTECARRLAGYDGFHPIEIPVDRPEQALTAIEEPVDFFLCTAVYQHFPSKEHGRRVTEVAQKLLRDGGLALIQIRYDTGEGRYRPKDRDYARNFVTFTSYPLHDFWVMAEETGFTPLAVNLRPPNHYAFFYMRKTGGR